MLGMHGANAQAAGGTPPGNIDGDRRQDWMDALHAVAAADGEVSPEELAEIDRIAAELGLR